jgi:dihydroxyacetone kinase
MLDGLDPFTKSLAGVKGTITQSLLMVAVEDAERGVEATARMKPRFGRSSYLGDRVLGYPDPGAKAVAIWLRAVCESMAPELPL